MIQVCWHEDPAHGQSVQGRGSYSCCTLLNQMFDRYDCNHWSGFHNLPETEGAVFVIQGGNERKSVHQIGYHAAQLDWVILIVIGDEESCFPLKKLPYHPRRKIWVQTPTPGVTVADRYLLEGYALDTPLFADANQRKMLDWFFAGQVTHLRRLQCIEQLEKLSGGVLIQTPGFMQGISHPEYYQYLAKAKIAICPSGPESPDSFRVAEALESGCVPIVDGHTPAYRQDNYWTFVLGTVPFPVIHDWRQLPQVLAETLENWEPLAIACRKWWHHYKKDFQTWLKADITSLHGVL